MIHKLTNPSDFIIALENNQDISFHKNGKWKIDNGFNIFKKDRSQFAHSFNDWFESLESIPVLFSNDPRLSLEQQVDFLYYLDVAQKVIHYLKTKPSKQINRVIGRLQLNIIALNYRLEVSNGGLDKTTANYAQLRKLLQLATFWKKRQKIFWLTHLTTENIEKLFIACLYPAFAEFILRNVHQREHFFKWTIRDNLIPETFIQFPAFHHKIRWANLHGRLARFGNTLLKVQKIPTLNNSHYEKLLTLPMEGKDTNILNLKQLVEFKGKYFLTIEEILRIFHEKKYKIGNLEFLPDSGITNWNSYCFGWWSAEEKKYHTIDLDKEEWWLLLPYTEVINQDTVKHRYCTEVEFKPGYWYLTTKASRELNNLSFQKTHAYLELAIPLQNGNYAIYNFGKFATTYPKNTWESIKNISSSVPGAIAYPDENIFYSHRQHVGYTLPPMEPEQGLKCMESIKRDLELSREQNIIFQFQTENCGHWVQNILEEQFDTKQLPNLFEIDVLDTEPHLGFENKLFAFMKIPSPYTMAFSSFYPVCMWSLKGQYVTDKNGNKVWRSIYRSNFWSNAKIYLPSLLHKHQEDKHKKPFEEHPLEDYIKKEVPHESFDPFSRLDIFDKQDTNVPVETQKK